MKRKNFTSKLNVLVSKSYIAFMFLFAFFVLQNANAQTADCPLSSNDMVQVSLNDNCEAIVTPEMIIEGENDNVVCNYKIYTIVDENGVEVGHAQAGTGNWVLDGGDAYKVLMGTVGFDPSNGNTTMGGIYLEDKLAPTLRCLDTVYATCSDLLDDYLTTNTDARYEYTGAQPIVGAVGGNTTDFPFIIAANSTITIPYDVSNEANQSEIMEYVQAVLSLSTSSNIQVRINAPTGSSGNALGSPFKDNWYYGIQATDPFITGSWNIDIVNNNAFQVTVNDAKLRVKSTGFLRIGNGVIVDDNCFTDKATIEILSDFTTVNDDMCGEWLRERKITYQGTDWRGMKSPVCEHVIRWEKKGFDDLVWPHNWDGIDNPPLSCTGKYLNEAVGGGYIESNKSWDTDENGHPLTDFPTIDGNPIWPDPVYCMINVGYTDERFDICEGSYKILRKWIAYDMCEPGGDDCCGDDANPRTHYQIIKVIDDSPMTFEVNFLHDITVSADPFNCSADVELPYPKVQSDGCSEGFTYEVVYCSTGDGVYESSNITSKLDSGKLIYTINDLPEGSTCVRYYVTDDCGNVASGALNVIVEDDIAPIPVCDEHTVVTVSTDCLARVKAESFDDGSFDNCTEVSFEVARMANVLHFGDYVDFTGNDVGHSGIQVVLKVIDGNGNENTCMVEVTVDNKFKPQIKCPNSFYVDCGTDYEEITNKGVPSVIYNCDFELDGPYYTPNLNQCGVGRVAKKWYVKVGGNRVENCTQTIYVENNTPFNMYKNDWPIDENNLVGCSNADTNPSNTGEPDVSGDNACSMVATTYSDRVFHVVEGACTKILRDWTVIDWCQYNDSNPDYLGEQGHPYEGMWTHTQVIMINDNNAPVITSSCATQPIDGYNADCSADVTLVAEADDTCTPDSELEWTYRVENSDGTLYENGNSNTFVKSHMDLGTYHIYWTVEDRCGNIDECDYTFVVRDGKKPTPLCYSDITTVVMPSTTPKMVTVKARDFDRGSTDNCTPGATCGECDTDLAFSFSGTSSTVTEKVFTEANVGLNTLDIWVWDLAGNRDFCTVTVHIQNNATGGLVFGGQVTTEDDKKVNNTVIESKDMIANETKSAVTNSNGYFEIVEDGSSNFDLSAKKKDSYINGLTTLDIVIIQKHLLDIRKMNSPYKLLAADANQDGKVTAGDILALRKIILGADKELKNTDAWTFVNGAINFENPNNPWTERDMHTIKLNNAVESILDNKFVAIKIGDVNNSVTLSTTSEFVEPRSIKAFNIDNVSYKSGDVVRMPVYASNFENIAGFQMGLNFGDLEILNVESGAMNMSKSNYRVDNNELYISWNSMKGNTYNDDEILFTIEFAASTAGQLINQIGVANTMSPEAYDNNLDVYGMELNFRNLEEGAFRLYQNTPNPFSNETEITFVIPESGMVTTTVYDIAGKVIKEVTDNYEKGENSVKMSRDDLNSISGVLYYKVEYKGNVAIKKMILLAK